VSAGTQDMPNVLQRIIASTRRELESRKQQRPLAELQQLSVAARGFAGEPVSAGESQSGEDSPIGSPRPFYTALTGPEIAVIAEFKRRSPSAGELRERPDLPSILGAYERGGASALSVLTEGPHFEGSLADLDAARAASRLPILRKDFIVDAYQLYEARAAGAAAVLLIVAALDDMTLATLHEQARGLGLDVLVEVHDREELARALHLGADLVGVNNRDLRDFSVDVGRTTQLLGEIPDGVAVVSESGIHSPAQLRELHAQGIQAVLVGESLMRAADPEQALRALLEFREPDDEL
jgi:indole-3-glycerol phosphate synthase